jgi:dihydrofolate reductase
LEEAIRAVSPTSSSSSSSSTSSSTSSTSPNDPPPKATTPPNNTPTPTNYLIGGAQLYTFALHRDLVDRILFTRILSPGFDSCDVFLPDFTGEFRKSLQEDDHVNDDDHEDIKENKEDVEKANSKEKEETSSVWKFKQRPHKTLEDFVGFEVPEGEVEEKGVRYRFELWEREE